MTATRRIPIVALSLATAAVLAVSPARISHASVAGTAVQSTVVQSHLGAVVVSAVFTVEQCTTTATNEASCDGLRQIEHQAERALLTGYQASHAAGTDVLTAADAPYANVPVSFMQAGQYSFISVPLSASMNPSLAKLGNATGATQRAAWGHAFHIAPHIHLRGTEGYSFANHGCDSTWCYAHISVQYATSPYWDALVFDLDYKWPANGSTTAPVWGSNWRVSGNTSPPDSWSNFWYSNSTNSNHSVLWPVAHGTLAASVGPIQGTSSVYNNYTLWLNNISCSGTGL